MNKPITTLAPGELGSGLKFAADGSFGTSSIDWKLGGGATVTVSATQSGVAIPGDELFINPIVVGSNQTVVSVAFSPTLAASFATGIGDLHFGFSVGGGVEFRSGRTYEVASVAPSLKDALADMFSTGIIPGNIVDVKDMKARDIGSVSGVGELKMSGSFDVVRAINPLVSPTLLLKQIGTAQFDAGASLTVGANVTVRGRYQVRVQKLTDNTVRLAYYKMAGSQFDFSVKASAGATLTLQKKELLEKLMGFLGTPKADVTALVDAGLSDQQIADIQKAIEASISRSVAISLAASFSSSKDETKVFEYEFDLGLLGNDGVAALQAALQADLSALTSANVLPAGIRLIHSELEVVRKQRTVWKINLIGLLNVLHVHELISKGTTLFNADTGELVITDSTTGKNLRVETRPLEADTKKLHKVLLQSLVITAAYRASGLQKTLEFTGAMTYFEQSGNANRGNISDMLDNFVCAMLISPEEKKAFLEGRSFSGRASVFFDLTLTHADLTAMFLKAGVARDQDDYELIARQCMERLVQPGDERDFRRVLLNFSDAGNDLWRRARSAGPAALQSVLSTLR